MDCIVCFSNAEYKVGKTYIDYKGEKFLIDQHYYKCNSCGEEFTTNELDEISMRNLYLEYWKNHVDEGVLFDNVISNLDVYKSLPEYKYMLEHYYIYTKEELETILHTISKSYEYYPELDELYIKVRNISNKQI